MAEARHISELSLEELAETGYEPRVIASAAKLPPQLVEEMLALTKPKKPNIESALARPNKRGYRQLVQTPGIGQNKSRQNPLEIGVSPHLQDNLMEKAPDAGNR